MEDCWDDYGGGVQVSKQYDLADTGVGFGNRGRGFQSFSDMKGNLPNPGIPKKISDDNWGTSAGSGWNNSENKNTDSNLWEDAPSGRDTNKNTSVNNSNDLWDDGNSNNNTNNWSSSSNDRPYRERKPRSNYSDQEDFPRGGGMNSRKECFKCKEEGHMSRDCPNSDNQGGGGGRGRACFKCNEEGHISRDCPNGGGGGGGRSCYKCNEEGHMSRDCPNGRGGGGRACFKCGEEGHMSRECPNPSSNAGGGTRGGGRDNDGTKKSGCFNCGESGHMSKDCTNPASTTGPDGKPHSTYVPPAINYSTLFESGLSTGINFDKFEKTPFHVTGNSAPPPINSFNDVRFHSIIQENIAKSGYKLPTPVQKQAIPIILKKRDLMACAETGSGKTAAFLLPMIQDMVMNGDLPTNTSFPVEPLAVIISPTRELAIQIYREACKFSKDTGVLPQILYGGTSVSHQANELRNGCHILVATVGRLWDFIGKGKVNFFKLQYMVLDEADRILDMGFLEEVRKFFEHSSMPEKGTRQTLMFSATFPDQIQNLATDFMHDYLYLAVGIAGSANSDITQTFFPVSQYDKRKKLMEILADRGNDKTLVFVDKKRTADFIASYMSQNNLPSTSIHGDRLQPEREEALRDFESGTRPILVATAVASRGLDIKDVHHVINYDLPQSVDEYIHRIGRTGRIGNLGKATSFYDSSTDQPLVRALVDILAKSNQEVPDWLQDEARGCGGYVQSRPNQGSGRFPSRDIRSGNQSLNDGWSHNNGSGDTSEAQFAMDQPLTAEESWD